MFSLFRKKILEPVSFPYFFCDLQYSWAPKDGQAGVSRYLKNIPGWKVEDKKKLERRS